MAAPDDGGFVDVTPQQAVLARPSKAHGVATGFQVAGFVVGVWLAVVSCSTAKPSVATAEARVAIAALLSLGVVALVKYRPAGEGFIALAASLLTTLPLVITQAQDSDGNVPFGTTVPAVVLPWLALAWDVLPTTRIMLVVMQYLAAVPFFEATIGRDQATNVGMALGTVHLLLVWATMPTQGRWRTAVLGVGLATCVAVAIWAIVAFASTGTNLLGRAVLATAAIAVGSGLAALLFVPAARSWRVRPPLGVPALL